jgi:hypothetical protein
MGFNKVSGSQADVYAVYTFKVEKTPPLTTDNAASFQS